MSQNLMAQRVEDVPQTATVRDFDELGDEQQQAVQDVVDGEYGGGPVDESLDGEVVRFTDYYRIRVAGRRASD